MAKKVSSKKVAAKVAKLPSSKSVKKASKPSAIAVKTAKAAKTASAVPVKHKINIDHPSHNDSISRHHYAVRISCAAPGRAELSVNGGPWMSCREAVGFCWFDWCPSDSGQHVLAVRLLDEHGHVMCVSPAVSVDVV
jgi:hypothetical protein